MPNLQNCRIAWFINNDRMRVIDIVPGTSVDGPGLRTAIYFAGCIHQCPGCHNPQSWNVDSGNEMTADEIFAIVEENGFDVTFTGGDPLLQSEELAGLAQRIAETGKTIWCYTGFLYDRVMSDVYMRAVLENVEVLVDGPFVEALKDKALVFRGSSNQRLIDVAQSAPGRPVMWDDGSFTAIP